MTYAEPDIRNAPLTLWRIARAFIVLLHDLFGSPQDIARHGVLLLKEHTHLNCWLRTAEALLRHLLLIEASHIGAPAPSPAASTHRAYKPRLFEFDPEKPDDWRVRFRCFTERRRPRRPTPAHAGVGAGAPTRSNLPGLRNAWPIALRYQALLRVFNDPYAFAKRLARRLFAKPNRTSDLRHTPPKFFDRIDHAEAITTAAAEAEIKFRDSS